MLQVPAHRAKDNTVKLEEHTLQLMPGPERASYARARVELQERLDGSLVVTYQGNTIGSRPAPPNPVTLRARKAQQHPPQKEKGTAGEPDVPSSPCNPSIPHLRNGKTPVAKPGPDHPWRKTWW